MSIDVRYFRRNGYVQHVTARAHGLGLKIAAEKPAVEHLAEYPMAGLGSACMSGLQALKPVPHAMRAT